MRAVPHKIIDKEFKKAVRGYDASEVDEFLDEIADDFENLYRENSDLRDKMEKLNEKMEYYISMEKNLQNTLLLAQSTAETAKKQAEKEAELIIRNAEDYSNKMIGDIENEKRQILRDTERLRGEFKQFRERVLRFMESQTEAFKKASYDIEGNDLIHTSLDAKKVIDELLETEDRDSSGDTYIFDKIPEGINPVG